jgi:hypothetical protein
VFDDVEDPGQYLNEDLTPDREAAAGRFSLLSQLVWGAFSHPGARFYRHGTQQTHTCSPSIQRQHPPPP